MQQHADTYRKDEPEGEGLQGEEGNKEEGMAPVLQYEEGPMLIEALGVDAGSDEDVEMEQATVGEMRDQAEERQDIKRTRLTPPDINWCPHSRGDACDDCKVSYGWQEGKIEDGHEEEKEQKGENECETTNRETNCKNYDEGVEWYCP